MVPDIPNRHSFSLFNICATTAQFFWFAIGLVLPVDATGAAGVRNSKPNHPKSHAQDAINWWCCCYGRLTTVDDVARWNCRVPFNGSHNKFATHCGASPSPTSTIDGFGCIFFLVVTRASQMYESESPFHSHNATSVACFPSISATRAFSRKKHYTISTACL